MRAGVCASAGQANANNKMQDKMCLPARGNGDPEHGPVLIADRTKIHS
jgi:hypothetical protein